MQDGKWIEDLTPEMPVAEAARLVLSTRLGVVGRCLSLALHKSHEDIEHVHQLRVATRRARAALDIFMNCLSSEAYAKGKKQLRRIRRAAGAARDWDVFRLALTDSKRRLSPRERAGCDLLTGYALAQRSVAQKQLEDLGDDYTDRFERVEAEVVAGVSANRHRQSLLQLAQTLLAELVQKVNDALAGDLEDYTKLHQARIEGKKLRYAIEVFAACFPPAFRERSYPVVEEMQDILGDANDSHVASGHLRDVRALLDVLPPRTKQRLLPGVDSFLSFHEKRLARQRVKFAKWMQQWRKSDMPAVILQSA